jgi:hypothetical protein
VIRLLLLATVCAGIFLLWDKTSLPNVSPLSGEELTQMMKDDSDPAGGSLKEAFAGVARALEEKTPINQGLSPEQQALAESSPALVEYLRQGGSDPREAAKHILASIESLPHDSWNDRHRLLMLAQALGERELGFNDALFVSIGLRQLEIPTTEDVRDPAAIEVIQQAADLVARRTPDPAKRAALLSQLTPLHASEAVREELERSLTR